MRKHGRALYLPRLLSLMAGWLVLFVGSSSSIRAQAVPTATGPGPLLSVGGTVSYYQADYGKRYLGGGTAYLDFNRGQHFGWEAEARLLRYNEEFGTNETTYLAGPRLRWHRGWLRPYAKLLVGEGQFHFPYNYGDGTYFVYALGGGVDIPIGGSRFGLRVLDAEYQGWPNFSFGQLHPYGVSSGVSIRIF